MTQTIVSVVLFLAVLGLLPLAIRWYQQRSPGSGTPTAASRVLSTVPVGPQQRVVTIEVGPQGARTWLVLGVTAQQITCLHSQPVHSHPQGHYVPPPTVGREVGHAGGSA